MPILQTQTAGMACGVEGSTHGSTALQVDRCRPISGTDASEDALLYEHLERKFMKGPVQDAQTQDWS